MLSLKCLFEPSTKLFLYSSLSSLDLSEILGLLNVKFVTTRYKVAAIPAKNPMIIPIIIWIKVYNIITTQLNDDTEFPN